MLAFHPTHFTPNGTAFTIVRDLDEVAELENGNALCYNHEESADLHLIHNYVGVIGPNTFEIENHNAICELEVLSVHSCMPYEIVGKTKSKAKW